MSETGSQDNQESFHYEKAKKEQFRRGVRIVLIGAVVWLVLMVGLGALGWWGYQSFMHHQEDKALHALESRAKTGNADAQVELGMLYDQGWGGREKNSEKAMAWYLRAAKQGNAVAMNNIGELHRRGRGVPVDYGKAMEWYQKSEKTKANPITECNIGLMYRHGFGVPADQAQADAWWTKSVRTGTVWDFLNLANDFSTGQTVEPDLETGYMWYYLAAAIDQEVVEKNLKPLEKKLSPEVLAHAKAKAKMLADKADRSLDFDLVP